MDFKKNRLLIGGGILIVLLGLVIYSTNEREKEDRPDEPAEEELAELLPDIDEETITELEIHRPDTPVVKLVKEGDDWRLTEPVDAPGDPTVISTALEKLGALDVVRVVTTNAENHERLEVNDEAAIRVIARAGSEELINAFVGAYGDGNTMVRQDGADDVLAVEGSIKFAFNKEVKDWRNRLVLDESANEVVGLTFENEGGTWNFYRGDDNQWAQLGGEETIERFAPAKVQSVAASLARLRAVNFAEAGISSTDAGFDETASKVTLTIREGGADEDTDADAEGDDHAGHDHGEGEHTHGEEGEEPTAETPAEAEVAATDMPAGRQIVLFASNSGPQDNEFYLMREGHDVIFVVSGYSAERIKVNIESFQNPEPGEEGEEAEAPPGMPPGGMPGMPGIPPGGPGGPGGEGQIPPEIMQQIQQQLQQQQATMQ